MSARKIGKSWWVDFRYTGQRYRKKSPINTAEGARQYEVVLMGRLMRGEPVDGPAHMTSPTLTAFSQQWVDSYVAANNRPIEQVKKASALQHHILPVLGRRRLDGISAAHIEEFKALLAGRGLAAKSINNILAILRKCLGCAVEWGKLPSAPPIRPLKAAPPDMDYLSEHETKVLRTYCSEHPEAFAMVLTAVDTGMRKGELRALRWDDLDMESGTVVVARSFTRELEFSPKSNRVRAVPMTSAVRTMLSTRPRLGERVFPGRDGKAMSESVAGHLILRAYKAAGLRVGGWHRLRHTFATRATRRGNSLRAVQTLLGHSTLAMTERYAHVAPSYERAVVRTLEDELPSEDGQPVGNASPALLRTLPTASTHLR